MDRNDMPDDPNKKIIMYRNDTSDNSKKINHHERRQENFISTIFIVLSLLIIGSVIVINSISNNNYKNNVQPQDNIQPGITPGTESNLDLNNIIDETAPDQQEQPTASEPTATEEDTSSSAAVAAEAVDLTKIQNPVSSTEITMAYSLGTNPVFSKTFNEYRSDHAGIDLKAEIGEDVKCAYNGKVVEIRNDPKLGTTIKIDHGDNICTEYANLAADVKVNLNDTVEAGQVIAKVGNTALYEISDGPHLHFALLVKGNYTDPTEYIK